MRVASTAARVLAAAAALTAALATVALAGSGCSRAHDGTLRGIELAPDPELRLADGLERERGVVPCPRGRQRIADETSWP